MNRHRFDPFGDLSAFRDNLGRLLEEQSAATRGQSRVWQPPMDIIETQEEWRIRLDLPGLAKDSIDIQMTGEQLTVRGVRQEESRESGHLVHSERPVGAFVRTVTLG